MADGARILYFRQPGEGKEKTPVEQRAGFFARRAARLAKRRAEEECSRKQASIRAIIEKVRNAEERNMTEAVWKFTNADLSEMPEFQKEFILAVGERLEKAQVLREEDVVVGRDLRNPRIKKYSEIYGFALLALNMIASLATDEAEALLFREWKFKSASLARLVEDAQDQFSVYKKNM